MSTEPLATYSERLLEVRRDFALYDDRVVVRARWFPRRDYEHVVKLAALRGDVEELTVRYRMYRYAGWVLAVGALCYAAITYLEPDAMALRIVGYISFAVMVAGAAFVTLTYRMRRIRFARFPTRSGRIGLDIASASGGHAAFDAFVAQVRRQINR